MANFQSDGGIRTWASVARATFMVVRLRLSALPFSWSWWGIGFVCFLPIYVVNC